MTDMLSRTIGRYQIGELIGEGAMAKVYRAYDPQMNRRVAMKVLKENFCQDEEYVGRFMREAKAARALQHPNIATVYDSGTFDSAPYTMQEFPDGLGLGAILEESGKLPVDKALKIGIQLCEALDYSHKSGVAHRNITPDNIVVLPDGISIKVADFGVARIEEVETSQRTGVGSLAGSSRHGLQQQEPGDSVDGRADLFAVGLILYQMLTGEDAHVVATLATQMTRTTQKESSPVKEFLPDAPAGVRRIIRKLLRDNPDNRYQTGEEVVQALTGELHKLDDREEQHGRQKYIPLNARWLLSMVLFVGLVMTVTGSVFFNKLSEAVTSQAVDSGASFASFVATEMANPLLGEEWILVDAFVTEAASREIFSYLTVIDDAGIVRGSSDKKLIGKRYDPDSGAILTSEKDNVRVTSTQLTDGSAVFNITAPVLFQDTPVGSIVLGVSQDGLLEVKAAATSLILWLAVVTIASVAVVLFAGSGRIGESVRAVVAAMQRRFFAEDGQNTVAGAAGSALTRNFKAAPTTAAPRQKFCHLDSMKRRWNSALSGTLAFFRSKIAALRGATSALMARLLLLIQQSIASKLEKLEAGRKARPTTVEAAATEDEALAPEAHEGNARESGEILAAGAPAREERAAEIEQGVAVENRQLEQDQSASEADPSTPVSQPVDQNVGDADLKASQQRAHRDCEGAVARAVAKLEASTAEQQAAEREMEQEKERTEAGPAKESDEIAAAKKQPGHSGQAADDGEATEESAAGAPRSGSEARSGGTRLNGSDPRDSAIVLASLPPKHPK